MAYSVAVLDDIAAADPEDHIRIPPSTEALLAYAAEEVEDRTPIPGHTFSLFVRTVTVNGFPTPALWDLGCNRSLMPLDVAVRLPGAILDTSSQKTLETAGGLFRTEGTIRARLCLTPTSSVVHEFVVSKYSPRLLIGGDVLASCFAAVYFSLDNTFHLYGQGAPEIVRMEDPSPWGSDSYANMAAYQVAVTDLPRAQPHEVSEQDSITLQHQDAVTNLLEDFDDVFISQGPAMQAQPPCPSPQPWDFDVSLMAEPLKRAYCRPASGDPVQSTFFARWLKGMTSSGRRPRARWNNAISRATGEVYYVAPARAIKKHDGDYSGPIETWDLRVVVDYREVNANSALPGRTSCPHISTLLNSIAKKRYKSKLDLRHGFFNVGIANEKTRRCFAFSTPQGIFLPNVMPMGAKGSPDALMHMMHTIFETLIAEGVMFVYLDDLMIATDTVEEHFAILRKVLALARKFDLSFKRTKCEFLRLEVQFLGFTVADGAIYPGRRIADAIQAVRCPTSKAEVRTFVAMCNYFRCFIPDFGRIAAALTDMQRGADTQFVWGTAQQDAFLALKQALSSAPVLRPFYFGRPTVTVHDASTAGAGAVLLQQAEPSGPWHMCDAWSKRWPAGYEKHSITELETRAIVEPIDGPWRHLLIFQEFTAFTDHSACTYLLTKDERRLTKHDERSRVKLSQYALKAIEHVPGKHNSVADALSRLHSCYSQTIFVLDAFAGAGTLLRALDQSLPLHVQIVYVAVELDPQAREVICNVVARINQSRPGRVAPSDAQDTALFPFQFGHDMETLDLASLTQAAAAHPTSICGAGPPCQPFSPANMAALRWADPREGFTALQRVLHAFTIWFVENVLLDQEDAELVTALFGSQPPVELEASDLGPARRRRMVWANFPIAQPTEEDRERYGFNWEDILEGDYEAPRAKAPTQLASKNSYADRRGETLVTHREDGRRRRMTAKEKETCIGLVPGDITDVTPDYWDVHRMVGNAFPVPCQRHILLQAVRQFSIVGPNHPKPAASAFSVEESWDSNHFDQDTIRAIAGRDPAYAREIADLPTDPSRYPHQRDGLIILEEDIIQIPQSRVLRSQIVEHYHKLLNHRGASKVAPPIKARFYWKGMDSDIKAVVKTCTACQLTKKGSAVARSLKTFTVDTGPWQTLHIDITMIYHGLPEDAVSSAVIVVDRFSRFTILIPCVHALSAQAMFDLLDSHVFCYYGIPQRIVADNGPPFGSTYWGDVLEFLGTRRGHTTVYRPETNGLVERMNRTVKDLLRTVAADLNLKGPDDIRKALPWAMWSINATENRTIGMSPFEALTMCKPHIPQGFLEPPPQVPEATADRLQRATAIWRHVVTRLEAHNAKVQAQIGHNEWVPMKGDPVMVHRRRKGGQLNVDEADYAGPYPVIAALGNQILLGQTPNATGQAQVHVSRLKPAHLRPQDAQPDAQGQFAYTRVAYRDYSSLQTQSFPTLAVDWASGEQTHELERGDLGSQYRRDATQLGLPMFYQKGITRKNVAEVFNFQTLVLGCKRPILLNPAPRAASSLTQAQARRIQVTPEATLLRIVVREGPFLGIVDDYHASDVENKQWRVTWQDGQLTWHGASWISEHVYGHAGEDFTRTLALKEQKQLATLLHGCEPPLHEYLKANPESPLGSRRLPPLKLRASRRRSTQR